MFTCSGSDCCACFTSAGAGDDGAGVCEEDFPVVSCTFSVGVGGVGSDAGTGVALRSRVISTGGRGCAVGESFECT